MNTPMRAVSSVIGIDRMDMNGNMILIEEHHGSDATFLISTVLSHALKKGQGVCLVLYHHNFAHYHNVCIKMGCNLLNAKESNNITVVEPMKLILDDIDGIGHDSKSCQLLPEKCYPKVHTSLVYRHFELVKEKYFQAKKSNESVVIIIDDLSHLFDLGVSLKDTMNYVRYLRSLQQLNPKSELCVLIHTYREDDSSENLYSDTAAEGLRQMTQLIVSTEPLRTGHSKDASGRLTVSWRIDSVSDEYGWPEQRIYLYKLLDGRVRIFAPGTVGV